MKKLILHIGTHKTATTTIQNTLSTNRSELRKQSVLYGSTDREPFPHLAKHTSLYAALMEGGDAFDREYDIILKEFDESGLDTLLLSEEGFSEPRPKRHRPMARFAEKFDIEVICFLRRPDLHLESHWNQLCRQGQEKRNITDYSQAATSLRRIRYASILDFWSEIGNVHAMEFDQAKAQGILAAFASLSGVTIPAGPELHANQSPSMNCAMLLAMLNETGESYDKREVVKAFKSDKCKYALGSRRRREVLAETAKEMRRLSRNYGVTFSADMPQEPEEPLLAPDGKALARAVALLSTAAASDHRKAGPNASTKNLAGAAS